MGYGTVRAMTVVLSISSQVVRGHVGNSAAVPVLRAFGHDVWPVPTVILSNHPGHGSTAGFAANSDDLRAIINELANHGWLQNCNTVLTGYFRDVRQCALAAETIHRMRSANPDLLYCCDPVLGDDPGGLYVSEEIASAVRDYLIPLADVVVPNRFELEWLSGCAVEDAPSAARAARRLGPAQVVATSVPAKGNSIDTVWVTSDEVFTANVKHINDVQHGIGDLTTAAVLAWLLAGDPPQRALGRVTALGQQILSVSRGRDELDLLEGLRGMDKIEPAETTVLAHDG